MSSLQKKDQVDRKDEKSCVFCGISRERIVNTVVSATGEVFYLIDSLFPVTENGHLLIIPKLHLDTIIHFTPDDAIAIQLMIRVGIERLQERSSKFTGFNIGWNLGKSAGQTIEHVHCHIIARQDGDVEDPRGGIRNVIPKKGNYLK